MSEKRCDKCESYRDGMCFVQLWAEGVKLPCPRPAEADESCYLYEEKTDDSDQQDCL